jgi:hypothetical protein
MANKIILKKSSVAAKVPVVGDLEYGELALNYTDEKLYFKNASNVIKSISAVDTSSFVTLTGTQTLTNKTISGASNTLSNIGNASLTNSSVTVGSTAIALGASATTIAGLTSVTSTGFTGALTGNASTATTLATGRTVAITGDLSYTSGAFNGSANVTGTGTLATVNSNVGSFTNASVTVNAKGLVTAASSGTAPVTSVTGTAPIVSSGGATPAISISAATTSAAGSMSSADKTKLDGIATNATANTGTVTSVGGTGTVSGITLTGTVTTSGNLTLGGTLSVTPSNFASQTANTVLAAPNGASGVPTFRAIVAADIPTLNQNTTGTSSGVIRTVAGTTSAELVRGNMGDNDQARILVGATASNAGFLEIATADDGTEPIHVRQYTGVFTTLTRTATLLDGSGNTSFPGTVTAPTFSGALSGNATTATTLQTARTIGGVSFNGSANINLPGVNTAGNQNTTGNASTATTLQTARTINGVSFNGSANITVAANTTNALTIGTGLSGTSFNGSGAVTIAIDSTVATLTGTQTLTNKTLTSPRVGTGIFDTNGNEILNIVPVASAVNELSISNAATGGSVLLSTAGTDANINLLIQTKGTGTITLDTGTGAGFIDLKPGVDALRLYDDDSSHYYRFVTGNRTANYDITLPAGSVTLTAGTSVVTTRSISTTAPLAGGGDLSANRTLSLAAGYGDTQNPYASKTANNFLAAPNGAAGVPTFRAIVAADIPTLNQNTTGSAATLTTARTIGGVSFNGSANINLPGVNTAGNQSTTGNAATATTLQTARTIGGVSFNGSANINLPGVNTAGNQNTSGTAAISTAATITTSATASAFKVPFANTTTSTTGNYGLLQDSEATFTYNPSTNTLTAGTFSGALSGNAATATTLQTTRAINGVNFNGSAAITVPGNYTNRTTNESGHLQFIGTTATGNQSQYTNTNLRVNPATATVTSQTGAFAAPFLLNANTISTSYSIPSGYNAVAAGPVVINNGITVTIPDGSTWVIV